MEQKICRICLDSTATISLFDRQESQDEIKYCTKLMRCVNIVILEGDGLPDGLCEQCAGELSVSYDFVNKCEASDKALRSVVQQSNNQSNFEIKEEDMKLEITEDIDFSSLGDLFISNDDVETTKKNKKGKAKVKQSQTGLTSCSVCGYHAVCRSALQNHMRTHTKEKPFCCDSCQSMFSSKETLKRHMETSHGMLIGRKNKKNKIYNRTSRIKSGPMQCVTCGLMVQSSSAMQAHTRTHTGEKPFCCDVCNMQFSIKGSLKKHIETRHSVRERKFVCESCGSSFFRKSEIIAHLRRHTDERPYACKLCAKRFRQISSLIRHKYSHTGERRHSCPICHKTFYDKCAIRKHLLVHSDERKYSCHLCNKSVKSKSSLATHLKIHSNEKQNICSYCGMAFLLKGNLQTHVRRKHSEKSGQCAICMKTFPDLVEHMRKHTGEKPYICKICDQAYAIQRSLSYHIMFKHENAEKFKCSIGECTKTFPTGKLLEMHLLKHHTNHTPYICPHCSRGFFRTSDLTRHLKGSHMDTSKIHTKTPIQVAIEAIK